MPNHTHRFRDYPFAVQLAVILIIAWVAFQGLALGSTFIIPFFLGLLLAFVLSPLMDRLERRGWKPVWAAILCVAVYLLVLAAILGGLGLAVSSFASSGGEQSFSQRLGELQAETVNWLHQTFGLPKDQIEKALNEQRGKLGQYVTRAASALGTLFSGLTVLFLLVPFYIFTMLYFRQHWVRFWTWALDSGGSDRATARTLAIQAASMARSYLVGELMRISILSALYITGLGLFGVPHFVLLGLICGLLNIIPFLGALLANVLPPVVMLVSGQDAGLALATLGFTVLVQVLDEYLIMPKLVGGKVQLNPMVTLMASLLGLLVWGIVGMVLFIPLTGIARIILAQYPKTRPYSFVLSDPEADEKG